jgi:methionyl-tRNA synthetase
MSHIDFEQIRNKLPGMQNTSKNTSSSRRILATAALPYANGSIHVGHLVEYLQADFWTRFQRLQGHECHYVCADDTHGTAIMVEARKRNITPESLIAEKWQEHTRDFKDFQIEFSHYSSTNSDENRALCEEFYGHMKSKGHLALKDVTQLYCNHDKMFLPDRFVKGTCPKCGAQDQYGDSCDKCGATYGPSELKAPYCSVCGTPPVLNSSEHILFKLNDFKSYLKDWLPGHTSKEMSNKMMEWFNEDLRDWDISRDDPYFGFQIPGTDKKYFYVWVDAPMGYISSSLQFFKKQGEPQKFQEFWQSDIGTEVYHFIGKDIVYFHTLFWPALLKTAGYRSPDQVFVHGMLTVNGEKMSKSKGTSITARTYLKHLDPMYLRYYYASKMAGGVDDLDLNLDDFINRVNSDLVGKITNLASRGAQMLSKKMDGVMSTPDADGEKLLALAHERSAVIADAFEARDFGRGLNEIRFLADEANRYFDEKAPWKTLAENPEATKKVLSTTLNLFRALAIYLKPILPEYCKKVEKLFGDTKSIEGYLWADAKTVLKNHKIQDYEHLATRVDPEKVKAMTEDSKPPAAPAPVAAPTPAPSPDRNAASSQEIEFADFEKVDLRVALITEAEEIKEADKLLRLKVNLGPLGERQIIAGIKSAYKPEQLKGRLTVVVANLKPRKMKFGMSEGMVIAAGEGGSSLFILSPDSGAKPGDKVK